MPGRGCSAKYGWADGFGIDPVSHSMGTESPFTWIKQPEHEANHTPPSLIPRFRICGTLPPFLRVPHGMVFNCAYGPVSRQLRSWGTH